MLLERIKAHSASLGDRPALTAGEKVIRWGELWPMGKGYLQRSSRRCLLCFLLMCSAIKLSVWKHSIVSELIQDFLST